MWPMHYLVGVTAKATHIPLHVVYYLFAFAALAAILVIVDRLLTTLRVDLTVYALCMGALILNAYIFRYLALAPGMINDTVFIAAVCFTTLGLVRQRLGWVVVGLTVAAVSRDLSVPPVLGAAVAWIAIGSWPGSRLSKSRLVAAAAAVLVPLLVLGAAYWAGLQAPGHAPALKNCCGLAAISIWGDLRGLPGSAHNLGVHLIRIVIGLAMPLALLLAGSILLRRKHERPAPLTWATGLTAALIVAQPLLISSSWNDGAEPRLTSLAIGPALAAVALLLMQLDLRLERADVVVLLVIFALASLSHRFANVGPRTPGQFAALVLACTVAAAGWLLGGRSLLHRQPVADATES
jgi:hypothetical protein